MKLQELELPIAKQQEFVQDSRSAQLGTRNYLLQKVLQASKSLLNELGRVLLQSVLYGLLRKRGDEKHV